MTSRESGEQTRTPSRRTGRRGGDSGTREAILVEARRQFAEQGYDRTSLRGIALGAGVDPTLVSHFYGSKAALFVLVVELPFDPATALPRVLEGDPSGIGGRLAGFLVGLLADEEVRSRVIGLIRAAASEPEAARRVRQLVIDELFVPLTRALGTHDAPLRAALLGTQVVGLVMARHVVGLPPLAEIDEERLAATLAPLLQLILTGPLPPD